MDASRKTATSASQPTGDGELARQPPAALRHRLDLLSRAEEDRTLAEQLGPAYTQGQVAELLGTSEQIVSTDAGLLRLGMRDGRVGYPLLQFDGDRVVPGMCEVVRILQPFAATSWTVASWLTSPAADLGGDTPLGRLRRGDVDEVVAVAQRVATAWAR